MYCHIMLHEQHVVLDNHLSRDAEVGQTVVHVDLIWLLWHESS